ncbi:MAG TPA: hypothetical protein DCO75_00125 [Fibrobacteres bacterium]|nr:hypothetical protein [Fibrobacterota bacterium]
MGDVILYKEDVDQLNFLLKGLMNETGILSALLITKDTRVLACQGTLSTADTGALAALLVGSFSSTQAIACLIGETEFNTMSHVGKSRNVIVSLVDEDTILVAIFDKNVTVDKVVKTIERHNGMFKNTLQAIGNNSADGLFDSVDNNNAGDENDFEKNADTLFKNIEPEPLPAEDKIQNSQPQAGAKPVKHHPDVKLSEYEENAKRNIAVASSSIKPGGIKRPPETQLLITEPPSSKDYEVYDLNNSDAPHHLPISHYSNQKKSPSHEDGKNDASLSSMTYLKNKAREGALYYHRDNAFFKKFFKTANKKRDD